MITKGIMLWSSNKFAFDLLDAIFNGADNKNYIGWPSIGGWWGEEVLIKSEISQSNRLRTLSWLFLVLNRWVDIYLNFPKCNFLCSLVLANILAITTGRLCQPMSCEQFNRSYIIVFLRYVLRCLRAEKLRSNVRDSCFFKNGSWTCIQQN